MIRWLLLAGILAWLVPAFGVQPSQAQMPKSCGIVSVITYPVETITDRGDDFGIYRGKFGGLHTGVDVAFYRYGDPIYAIADGRVTYANPVGWDTEKGVVILEHTFPDGSVYYSLYGHMEPIGDYFFPGIGQCVRQGDIVGAVGNPSLSAPHLHFEIRTFGPDDGGPGYWDTNPLEAGWEHPLDFIRRWQVRLQLGKAEADTPAASTIRAVSPPTVPPVVLPDGGLVIAESRRMEGINEAGAVRWRMEFASSLSGMILLADGRILAHTDDNAVYLLRDGRYEAVWRPDLVLIGSPLMVGNTVAFFTQDNRLAGYTPGGALLWVTPVLGDRIGSVTASADRLAVSTRPRTTDTQPAWHVISSSGEILYQVAPANPPYAAFGPSGDAFLLDGAALYHFDSSFTPTLIARLPDAAGRSTAMAADAAGSVYVFTALDENLLASYDASGSLRWDVILPGEHRQPPLLAPGEGCLLYALGADGTLAAIATGTGELLGQTQLYSGGSNGHPNARILEVLPGERVRFSAGYLTVATIDGYALAGITAETCPTDDK